MKQLEEELAAQNRRQGRERAELKMRVLEAEAQADFGDSFSVASYSTVSGVLGSDVLVSTTCPVDTSVCEGDAASAAHTEANNARSPLSDPGDCCRVAVAAPQPTVGANKVHISSAHGKSSPCRCWCHPGATVARVAVQLGCFWAQHSRREEESSLPEG